MSFVEKYASGDAATPKKVAPLLLSPSLVSHEIEPMLAHARNVLVARELKPGPKNPNDLARLMDIHAAEIDLVDDVLPDLYMEALEVAVFGSYIRGSHRGHTPRACAVVNAEDLKDRIETARKNVQEKIEALQIDDLEVAAHAKQFAATLFKVTADAVQRSVIFEMNRPAQRHH